MCTVRVESRAGQLKGYLSARPLTANSSSLYIAIGSECSHCDVTHWFVEFGFEASSLSLLASPSCFFGTRNVRRRFHILLIWAKCLKINSQQMLLSKSQILNTDSNTLTNGIDYISFVIWCLSS